MMQLVTILLATCIAINNGKLIVDRKETGDQVYGGYKNCSHGDTFFKTKSEKHCITSARDAGCYGNFSQFENMIPTVDATRFAKSLTAYLPMKKLCQTKLLLRVQYWDDKDGRVVYSNHHDNEIYRTINTELTRRDGLGYVVILNFSKHFPGLLLKLSFSCYGNNEQDNGACLMVKFNGRINHPLTRSYFQTRERKTNLSVAADKRDEKTTRRENTIDIKILIITILVMVALFICVIGSAMCVFVRKRYKPLPDIEKDIKGIGFLIHEEHEVKFADTTNGETFNSFMGALMAMSPAPYYCPYEKLTDNEKKRAKDNESLLKN